MKSNTCSVWRCCMFLSCALRCRPWGNEWPVDSQRQRWQISLKSTTRNICLLNWIYIVRCLPQNSVSAFNLLYFRPVPELPIGVYHIFSLKCRNCTGCLFNSLDFLTDWPPKRTAAQQQKQAGQQGNKGKKGTTTMANLIRLLSRNWPKCLVVAWCCPRRQLLLSCFATNETHNRINYEQIN